MLIEGEIIKDGMDMVSYLDRKLEQIRVANKIATGIIIGTRARKELSKACQHILGQNPKEDITINRFRNVLLIEDGENGDRLEVVFGAAPVLPVEGPSVLNLKRFGR